MSHKKDEASKDVRWFKGGIVFELQAIVLFLTACAIALTWQIPGWTGWAFVLVQAAAGIAAAIAIERMYKRAYRNSQR